MTVIAREAATLVLLHERPDAPPEVLMVRRHSRNATAGGAFVFPGGLLDEGDCASEALALCEGLDRETAASILGSAVSPERALGHFFAAIRETFEEVGVLLARDSSGKPWRPNAEDAAELRTVRAAMREGKVSFGEWLGARKLRPAVADLAYFAHWITPQAFPRRFDTRFFLCSVDEAALAEADQAEVVECRWIGAADALEACRLGTFEMVNATIKNLEALAPYASVAQMREALCEREISPILPKAIPLDRGFRIVNPWDPGYDAL